MAYPHWGGGQPQEAPTHQTTKTTGRGLVVNGHKLHVNVDGSTIEMVIDTLQLKEGGSITAKIANDAVTIEKNLNGNLSVLTSRGLTPGQNIPIGDAATIGVDHIMVLDLDAFNKLF